MRGSLPKVAVVLALLLAACTNSDEPTSGVDFIATQLRQDAAVDERPDAPAITGTTLDGEQIDIADLDGPVLINFWASWCGPCVSEAPHLAAISDEYADKDVTVVGVNLDTSVTNAKTFERDHEIPFDSIHDPSKEIASAFGRQGPAGLPTTIILDAEHRVASRLLGAVTARDLAPRLNALLDEGTS